MSENTEGTNTESNQGQDSSVINTLRKQLKEAQEQASAYQEQRGAVAERLLIDAGYPKLTEVFLSQVEGFPTEDGVGEFLEGLGLAKPQSTGDGTEGNPTPKENGQSAEGVAKVASLGQEVGNLASGQATPSVNKALEEAKTPADVQRIMEEAGLAFQS